MYELIVTLHVLGAILVVGPFPLAALAGYRAVRTLDADGTRTAARWMAWFGTASLVVAVLGLGALFSSDRFTIRTPWIIISITLYLLMMALATGYTVPALRKAAKLIDSGVPQRPAVPSGDEAAPPVSATATDLAAKERLDAVAGRIGGSGTLVLLAVVALTVLMVVKPFGD